MSMTPEQPLHEAAKRRPLLGDGAMGTQLMLAGLEQGSCGEAWNLAHPERVLAIQRRYAEAGSDCLLTNTFGGSRIMLNRHGHAADVAAINRAGVEIARQAFDGRPGWVVGDIGPFGGLMEPYGDFTEAQVREAFTEQAAALVAAGADAIIVETQTALEELGLGIQAAREAGARTIIGSMAYDVTLDGSTFRTMMGVDPERAAGFLFTSHRVPRVPPTDWRQPVGEACRPPAGRPSRCSDSPCTGTGCRQGLPEAPLRLGSDGF